MSRSSRAYEQSQEVHYCSKCDSYGQGQKMYNHMRHCDGTGLKNYWSRVKSDLLKSYAVGMISLSDVYSLLQELKDNAKQNRITYVDNQKALAQEYGLNAWERVTPKRDATL